MSLQKVLDEGTVEINEPDEFAGYWDGNHIWVNRVSDENWYIQVRAQDGCYIYDGYWPTDRRADVKEAVDEAFKGAMLIGEHDAHQATAMKVSELSGALLDYWVLRADGWIDDRLHDMQLTRNGEYCIAGVAPKHAVSGHCWRSPSADWALGGPIIERERIHLEPFPGGDEYPEWMAFEQSDGWGEPLDDSPRRQCGSTALEAAMRAYVASKFGAEVPDV